MEKLQIEKQGRIIIPKYFRDQLKLRSGEHIAAVIEQNRIILTPLKDTQEFITQLRGCVKENSIDPLELKKIWRM